MSAEIMMISAAVIILAISQIFHSNEGFVGTFTILGIAACETTLILSIIRSRSISLTLENARTTM